MYYGSFALIYKLVNTRRPMKQAVEPSTRPASKPKPVSPPETISSGEHRAALHAALHPRNTPALKEASLKQCAIQPINEWRLAPLSKSPSAGKCYPTLLFAGVPDQLNDIFGMSQRQDLPMSAPPAHDDLLGAFQDSSLSSPSERFGTPYSSPHPAVSAQQTSNDLLGGFEGSLGEPCGVLRSP